MGVRCRKSIQIIDPIICCGRVDCRKLCSAVIFAPHSATAWLCFFGLLVLHALRGSLFDTHFAYFWFQQ